MGKKWGRLGGISLHVRLSPDAYQALLARAKEENKPMSEVIRDAFQAYCRHKTLTKDEEAS